MKFQIQRELGAKPETSEEAKTSKYTPRLTEWLVPTILLDSMEEYPDEQHHRADDNLRHVRRRRREASEGRTAVLKNARPLSKKQACIEAVGDDRERSSDAHGISTPNVADCLRRNHGV